MKNRLKSRYKKLGILATYLAVCASVFGVGFASWSGSGAGDSVEAFISISGDEVQYAGFSNLSSKKTIRFDAPTTDTVGRIYYTNDVGGEQLTVDVTGTVLNYSEVGSLTISGEFDSDHASIFSTLVSIKYLVTPTFQTLSRKPTTSSPTSDGSYWTSDHDTVNDTRNFEIIASFSWGSFFNYKNPSIFFDSSETNSESKSGKEYTSDAIKTILASIREISHSTYNVNLSPEALTYTVNFLSSDTPTIASGSLPASITVSAGETFTIPNTTLSATGYDFLGYSYTKNSTTAEYSKGETHNINEFIALDSTINVFNLYTVFSAKSFTLTISVGTNETGSYSIKRGNTTIVSTTSIAAGKSATQTVQIGDVITFTVSVSGSYTAGSISQTNLTKSGNNYTVTGAGDPTITVANATGGGSCVLPNTLVTLADGSKTEIKNIKAGDMIRVFNHETGLIDVAPVTFNEKDDIQWFDVIHLEFSNGKDIGVISEHGFFDLETMRYEYIDEYNYSNFVGHKFYTEDGGNVTLVNAFVSKEYTETYSLPSFYHLNSFTEGILSMPGGIQGLFNIFEYGDNLQYDQEKYQQDIETYGLFTYEEMAPFGVTEEMFNAYAGKYLKVALGKGVLTEEYLLYLIERYGGYTD